MDRTLSISQARALLTKLPEELGQGGTATITRKGDPVLAVLPWEFYETIMETLEVLGDEDLMEQLRQGISDVRDGRTQDWEQAKADLGL